ncbi:YbhB/YbcL family Raf kinase inhibitor-like protein [Janibacter limosus]|uniref:YbhB/YbcL family Raf kinase inhibitor-like protein n=1 Tax=Janibacter limosus TaxID=53458 RepID=UPI0008333106|nr:YbhB/YbcL family Raf kinase inhibitor-like protein [Janibacter limosus]
MDLTRPTAPAPYDLLPETASFEVTSESFAEGETLSDAQVFDDWGFTGDNRSPQLTWRGAPEGTKSFAISCFDPDAPTPAGFWHWTVVGIPAGTTSLPEGAGAEGGAHLPQGAFMTVTDYGSKAFGGAAPPQGDIAHRYVFAVHALDTADLGIADSVSCTVAAFNYLQHTIGRAVITGTYRA